MKKWLHTVLTVSMSLLLVFHSFASTPTRNNIQKNQSNGILLTEGELSSKDTYQRYGRGEIFSTAIAEITNGKDGKIYVNIETYAHKGVDRIHHAFALDQWNEKTQDWDQVGFWNFEKTKEEEGGNSLFLLSTSITLSGYPMNMYYRVRGMHAVELNGEVETAATETHGVLITKN